MKFYDQIKVACFATMLATGTSYAAQPCDGFKITIDNKSPDLLLTHDFKVSGAEIQPNGWITVDKSSKVVLTVNNSKKDVMDGEIVLLAGPIIPLKHTNIMFTLENKSLVCEFTDKTGDKAVGYPLNNTRTIGGVTYTVNG